MAKKKCKSCAVGAIDDINYTLMITAAVTTVVVSKVDKMVVTNADGTPRDNIFARQPMVKNFAYAAAGVAIGATMDDDISKGASIGLFAYGSANILNSLLDQYMPNANAGIYGNRAPSFSGRPPQKIAGLQFNSVAPRFSKGSSGIVPTNIASQLTDNEYKMALENLGDRTIAKMHDNYVVIDEGLSAGM